MKPTYTDRLMIKLQPRLKAALKQRADSEGKEMSEFVRAMLELALKEER
jgi:predicted HicB family RNase H-like nuclease